MFLQDYNEKPCILVQMNTDQSLLTQKLACDITSKRETFEKF